MKSLIIKNMKVFKILKHKNKSFNELLQLNSEQILCRYPNNFHLNNCLRKNQNTQNQNTLILNILLENIKRLQQFGQRINQLISNKKSEARTIIGTMMRKKESLGAETISGEIMRSSLMTQKITDAVNSVVLNLSERLINMIYEEDKIINMMTMRMKIMIGLQ